MAKYCVDITGEVVGLYEVEADSIEEAEDQGRFLFNDEYYQIYFEQLTINSVDKVKDKQGDNISEGDE